MLGFEWQTPWDLRPGVWRCWVCTTCRIVSYHQIRWCPACGQVMFYDRDYSDRLAAKYPTCTSGRGDYRPYEWNPTLSDEQQPWRVNGWVGPPPVRESKEQQEHDVHAVAAYGP